MQNSAANILHTDSAHNILNTIRALDSGIINHEAWIGVVHQTLICDTDHSNPGDLCEDAHRHCKFGQWLNSPDAADLNHLKAFQTVVKEHQQMHTLARKILLQSKSRQKITEAEYGGFTTQAISFKLDVRTLQYELMSQVCVVDHLTGAWNRYAMYAKLTQERERLIRTGHPCSICMMDLDHFKKVNDSHGHTVGDLVLKTVIDFCRTNLRKYDSIYRYGGEEFLFCLPDAALNEVQTIIERLCVDLGQHPIPLPNGESLSVTASFGIASLMGESSIEDTMQAADCALMCAKSQGRNQVCSWDDGLMTLD